MENKVADAALAMAQGVYRSARLLDRQLAVPGIEPRPVGSIRLRSHVDSTTGICRRTRSQGVVSAGNRC